MNEYRIDVQDICNVQVCSLYTVCAFQLYEYFILLQLVIVDKWSSFFRNWVPLDSYSVALFIINLDYFSTRFFQESILWMVKNKQSEELLYRFILPLNIYSSLVKYIHVVLRYSINHMYTVCSFVSTSPMYLVYNFRKYYKHYWYCVK